MSKYILIQNDGEIETNSFELIGASTKRNDSAKIGFFGSGLKYSIAYMMRKGIEFKVYSGNNEITFTTKPETLKEQSFDRICINGNPTSYTTTMGPTWKEDWFVLREVYCNALDEGGCLIVKETENVSPSEGKTRIYIQITEELQEVTANWDAYFADERTPLFESEKVYTCYLGNDDGVVHHQKILAYQKTEGVLYRKGIRVHASKSLMYDYGCNHVNINEDRTAKNPNGLNYGIYNMFSSFVNEDYIKSILRTAQDDSRADEYYAVSMSEDASNWSAEWARFSRENLLVIKESSGKYADEIMASKREVFLIPQSFARDMKKNIPEAVVLGMSSMVGDYLTNEVELTPKMTFLLNEVIASLKEMKYDVLFDVEVVDFDDENVLGQADLKNKKIMIAAKTFDMGRREIAMTIMEENEHIKSGKGDETRAFQNHIFSQWLKSMEDNNGLFL
jgi:hypothetical protein